MATWGVNMNKARVGEPARGFIPNGNDANALRLAFNRSVRMPQLSI